MKTTIIFLSIILLKGCNQAVDFKDFDKAQKIEISILDNDKKFDSMDKFNLIKLKTIIIENPLNNEFKDVFNNKNNYESISRRCEFIPKYSISMDGKIVALFNSKSCPRIVYMNGTKEVFYDIVNNSKISDYIETLELK